MERLADHLSATSNTVVVVAPYHAGCEGFDRSRPYRVIRYREGSHIATLIALAAAYLKALRVTRDYTIAALWFPSGLVAACLPRFVRGRLGVLVHGREIEADHRGFRQRLLRFVFARAHAAIANSAFTGALLERAGVRDRICVVHCGVDDTSVAPQRSQTPVVLAVGRLVRRKGFDRLIEAMPAILARFPQARCEIVGEGPIGNELRGRCAELGVADAVVFFGALDDSDLATAYARAWCFALPVRTIDEDVEGFGIVYLEAAVAGIPSIGGRDSGAEDAIVSGETGFLVDGNDPGAIAERIIEVFADPQRSGAMGRAGRARALESFSWAGNAASIDARMRKR